MNNNKYKQLSISGFDDDSLLEIVLKHIERERRELDLFEKEVMSYKEKLEEENFQQTSKIVVIVTIIIQSIHLLIQENLKI